MEPNATLIICYARSGGTILNKCLGCLPNTVVLSEVNPLGCGSGKKKTEFRTINDQAKKWYNINLKSYNFTNSIIELYNICKKRKKHLIIRDWSFINFAPGPQNNFHPPNKLLTFELLKNKINLKTFVFIRDSIDVCLSRGKNPKKFFKKYKNYLDEIFKNNLPTIKYEDFCQNPKNTINEICKIAGLEYSENWQNFYNYKNVNGDIQLEKISRGANLKKIKIIPRKLTTKKIIDSIENNENMIKLNRLLGYPIKYNNKNIEKNLIKKIKYAIKNVYTK